MLFMLFQRAGSKSVAMAAGGDQVTKVLLVTASYGEGHNQAAHAVAEALVQRGATAHIVDYTDWLHPAVRSITKFSLMQGVQKVPALYGAFYRSMSRVNPHSSFQRQMHQLGMPQLKRFLKTMQPDVMVSTFPSPSGVLSELREAGYTDLPNAVVLTDYTFNGQWITKHTDRYFVPTESVRRAFIEQGVEADRLLVSGIPIRARFGEDLVRDLLDRRDALRREQGFTEEQPLVLMMGGGAGLLGDPGSWERVIHRSKAQFAIVCGNNARLQKRFAHLASPRVRVLGYASNVEEWMAMADLIVTKAGGITVTEALAMELPMLIYRPIPGQEVANADFAVASGAARLVPDVASAQAFLREVMTDRTVLDEMRGAAGRADVRNAANRIAVELLGLAERAHTNPN